MPPCLDVYVWIGGGHRADILAKFIDRYVDGDHPGDPRFDAFTRTFVADDPAPGDADALADLRRDPDATSAFSLYLHARAHYGAIITLTEEGDLVLGLELDDPYNDPETLSQATALLDVLMDEFEAQGGISGAELAPPQSASEWNQDGLVMIRVGTR